MARERILFLPLLFFVLQVSSIYGSQEAERKPYIVFLGDLQTSDRITAMETHHSLLQTVVLDKQLARNIKIHSYVKSFNAFAARLLPEEATMLKGMPGVISVFPNTIRKLHTTRSWDFIGLTQSAPRKAGTESNLVVGMLDTGIWPQSPSFDDKGLGPPPKKFRGKCVVTGNFTGCNNKIIGAKFFALHGGPDPDLDDPSPLDTMGHGTHTSSTVAGALIENANFYGLAEGTARGGVPSARIAVYKVCWYAACNDIDLLAGFDEAIDDGVDVISVSIGGNSIFDYMIDPLSIGAFYAMRKGILTSLSAGNSGPDLGTITNLSPWTISVAASGIDRQFRTDLQLGDGRRFTGSSLNSFPSVDKSFPLINSLDAAHDGDKYAEICLVDSLEEKKVKGKVVYCKSQSDIGVRDAQGSGMIGTIDETQMNVAFISVVRSTLLLPNDFQTVLKYINSTKNPQATIYKSYAINTTSTNFPYFSSRGPNGLSKNILKPDISAPGVDILAAYSIFPTITNGDDRHAKYNILSGTSMACPHVTAVAVYVKSFHPDWSPAAIQSAIMTTAKEMVVNASEAEFAYGAGQIDPRRAANPGLVYDADEKSYLRFLCKEGTYDNAMIGNLAGHKVDCSKLRLHPGSDGLNYPSMQHQVESNMSSVSAVFFREVTNVGRPGSVYRATVRAPEGLSVKVVPSVLSFNKNQRKKKFKVVVKSSSLNININPGDVLSASLVWSDSKHIVRSPIVVYKAVLLI